MRKKGLMLFLALTLPTTVVMAQDRTARFERQLEQIQRQTLLEADTAIPTEQRTLFDYGGFITFAFLAIDDARQNTHILRQTELNGYARVNIDNAHEFFVRGMTRYQDFNTGDSFDGEGDEWDEPRLERGHYRFDYRRYMAAYEGQTTDFDLTFTGGRQLVHWVNGLTLSQEIDGATARFGFGDFAIDAVGGITREETYDIDPFRPDFDDDTQRVFYGAMAGYQITPEHRPFVYGLVQEDHNDRDFDRNTFNTGPAVTPVPSRFEYDSYYIGGGSTGNLTDQLLYSVEAVYEGGRALSSSTTSNARGQITGPARQTEESIHAWALDTRIDYLFHDENKSRGVLEVVLASGDDDRSLFANSVVGGNTSGTSDTSFNGFGLVDTGLAFFPAVSNLVMVRAGLSTFPVPTSDVFRRLQIGGNVFVYHKLDDDAPISEPTADEAYLGTELDAFANWQVTSDFALVVRYGIFFPGEGIATDHDARHFFYSGVTYAF